jgi:hypothetical protein
MNSIFDDLPGFLELGAWTSHHIHPLFDLFSDENVAPALALIILGTALLLCVTVSAIRWISFVCAQARIEAE